MSCRIGGWIVLSALAAPGCAPAGRSMDVEPAQAEESAIARPVVVLETTMGEIVLELNRARAPITVENFLDYTRDGFYDGTIIHRIVEGDDKRIQVIQGGGYLPDMTLKPAGRPIPCEANNGLSNLRGTIAMARDEDPHSADSQFFINTADNPNLDYHSRGPDFWGYAVFGRVIEGMEVIDRIRKVPTEGDGDRVSVPVTPIVIQRAYKSHRDHTNAYPLGTMVEFQLP